MCWKKNVLCLFLTLSYQQHIPCKPVFTILLFSFSVDGVFGRCQELAGADLHTYDISSSALQRLRILLQKLAHRGTYCLFARPSLSECLSLSVRQPLSVMYRAYSKCLSTAIV